MQNLFQIVEIESCFKRGREDTSSSWYLHSMHTVLYILRTSAYTYLYGLCICVSQSACNLPAHPRI